MAYQPPDKHAARGHHEGGKPYCYRDDDDVDLKKRERDTHRHGVDAGSYRRRHQGGERSSLGRVIRRAPDCRVEHMNADAREEGEGDPMIDSLDKAAGCNAGDPTENGRCRLDNAEDQTCS